MGLIVTFKCQNCNGDGYLTVDKQSWLNYLSWVNDPTEDKLESNDNFPEFLKRMHTQWGISVGKVVTIPCFDCGGKKTITKDISFEELKNMIK